MITNNVVNFSMSTTLIDASTGNITITMPNAMLQKGHVHTFKRIDASQNKVELLFWDEKHVVPTRSLYANDTIVVQAMDEVQQWAILSLVRGFIRNAVNTITTASQLNIVDYSTTLIDATNGDITITLSSPNAASGRIQTFKRIDTTANVVTINCWDETRTISSRTLGIGKLMQFIPMEVSDGRWVVTLLN